MKDKQLEPIVLAVAAEWQAGGLGPDTMYGEFAMEVARRAVAAERERCAAWVDARRDAFCEEHGSIDPETNALEFGRGPHAEAKNDYVSELEEIATGLRALRA